MKKHPGRPPIDYSQRKNWNSSLYLGRTATERLDALCAATGMQRSAMIRALIAVAYQRLLKG